MQVDRNLRSQSSSAGKFFARIQAICRDPRSGVIRFLRGPQRKGERSDFKLRRRSRFAFFFPWLSLAIDGNLVFGRKERKETRQIRGRSIRRHRTQATFLISLFSLNCFSDVQRKWISADGAVLAEGRSAIEDGRSHKGGFQRTYFRDGGCKRGPWHVPVLCEERV